MGNLNFDADKQDLAMLKSMAKRSGISLVSVAKAMLHLGIQNAPETLSREARLAQEDARRQFPAEESPSEPSPDE